MALRKYPCSFFEMMKGFWLMFVDLKSLGCETNHLPRNRSTFRIEPHQWITQELVIPVYVYYDGVERHVLCHLHHSVLDICGSTQYCTKISKTDFFSCQYLFVAMS